MTKKYFKNSFIKPFSRIALCTLVAFGGLTVIHSPKTSKEADAKQSLKTESKPYIIKYKDGKKSATNQRFALTKSLVKSNKHTTNWDVKNLKSEDIEKINQDENIEYIQPNFKRRLFVTPNDTYYNSSGTYIPATNDQWNLRNINLLPVQSPSSNTSGWEITTGSSNTIVAVIDTGIDLTHPDLVSNIWVNNDANDGIDNDANGYIDDTNGFNFADGNRNVQDINGHGTHVSGTIAAATNNNLGIAGVCWTCKIMPLKVINSSGYGFDSDIAEAIYYAVENDAKVINMSLGGPGYSQLLEDAISYAWNNNVIVVASSGNDYGDASDNYPGAAMRSITVSAINNNNVIADFSNTGARIDISAPGVSILSTKLQSLPNDCVGSNPYRCLSGTSMAAPHIAGLAALISDLHRNDSTPWTAAEVRQVLLKNITDINPTGHDNNYGYGKPNAYLALTASRPTNDTTNPTGNLVPLSGSIQTDTVQITGSANDLNLYIYTINVVRNSDNYIQTQISGRSNVSNGTLASFDTNLVPDGVYNLVMRVEDFKGNAITTNTIQITIDNEPPGAFYGLFPIENTWTNLNDIELVWSSDNHSSATVYDLYIDGQLARDNVTNTSAIISGLTEGNHSWYLIAIDSSNQTTQSSTMHFGVDRTSSSEFTINTTVEGSKATFTFSSNDTLSGIDRYRASIDGQSYFEATSPFVQNMGDGNHSINITAYDKANNGRSSSKSFTTDTTPPNEFSITVVVEGSKATTYFSASDSLSSITKYDLFMDENLASIVNSPHTIQGIPDGNHKMTVRAFDSFGNHRISTKSFTIDTKTSFLKTKADFNASGKIDLSDLSILAQNWKKNTSNGDANNDGKVDLTDLSILAQNWNKTF